FQRYDQLSRTSVVQGKEGVKFAYAELGLPVVGPDQAVPGINRFEVTAAARQEDYDSFGSVTTPKLGLLISPDESISFKASWGRSFKAPTLLQLNQATNADLHPVAHYGGEGYAPGATVLSIWGGNQNLDAEHATTRSASLAFHPVAIPGFEAELTWFDIDYTDRVVQPITSSRVAFGDPA